MGILSQLRSRAISIHEEYCKLALAADIFEYVADNVPQMPLSELLEKYKNADLMLNTLRIGGDEKAANNVAALMIYWEKVANEKSLYWR